MKFFVPNAKDEQAAEKIYEAIRKFAASNLGWSITQRRVYRLRFREGSKDCQAVVGAPEPWDGQVVFAILETNGPFFVCTEQRGVIRGMPFLVGKEEVAELGVEDFGEAC